MSSILRTAIYPGSFDPVTLGHLDVIERAVKLFDKIIVTVATHRDKKPLFDMNERMEMLHHST